MFFGRSFGDFACLQMIGKMIFKQRKGSGNEGFSDWNPQEEFISDEENCGFQGIYANGTRLFIPLFQLVEILISTKGVDFVDTLTCLFPLCCAF